MYQELCEAPLLFTTGDEWGVPGLRQAYVVHGMCGGLCGGWGCREARGEGEGEGETSSDGGPDVDADGRVEGVDHDYQGPGAREKDGCGGSICMCV